MLGPRHPSHNYMLSTRVTGRLVLCLGALALLFAGCGRTARARGRLHLRVWSMWTGDEQKQFRSILDAYERTHPNVAVDDVTTNYEDSKTIRAIIAGSPPDLCTLADAHLVGQLAACKAVLRLDDRFARSGFRREQFTPGSIGQCLYKDQLYAMPYGVDCLALLWNKDAFREAGLDPNRPPRTLEELLSYAVRLTKKDSQGNITRLGCSLLNYPLLMQVFGGGIYDPARDAITADDPRNVAALRWYKRFIDAQGGMAKINAFSAGFGPPQSSHNPFFVNKIAILFSGEWNPYWACKYAPKIRYDVAPFPPLAGRAAATAGQPYALLGGNFLVIPTGAKHPQEAWDFFRWMESDEAQFLFADRLHNLPNTFAALRDERLRRGESWRPLFARFLDLSGSRNASYFPVLPMAGFADIQMANAVEQAGYGKKTPEEALRDVQRRISREYAKWRKR